MNFHALTQCSILSVMILASGAAVAKTPGWVFSPEASSEKMLTERGLRTVSDGLTEAQRNNMVPLSQEQLHQAEVWGLSQAAMQRYLALLNNESGFYYAANNLTPLEVLGLNARNDSELEHYAEQAARRDAVRLGRELAFNAAYENAAKRLQWENELPVILPFDDEGYKKHRNTELESGDAVSIYTDLRTEPSQLGYQIKAALKELDTVTFTVHLMTRDRIHYLKEWDQVFLHDPVLKKYVNVQVEQPGVIPAGNWVIFRAGELIQERRQ